MRALSEKAGRDVRAILTTSDFPGQSSTDAAPSPAISTDAASSVLLVDFADVPLSSQFLPILVLLPKFSVDNQTVPSGAAAQSKIAVVQRDNRGLFAKAMKQFEVPNAGSVAGFGEVTVNFSEMTATRQGELVALTAMEFKTLKYLILNVRRVISRSELLQEVWGYNAYPRTRTVDNHIMKLRHKLEREPSRPVHFRTVHGAGYKFVP
jgi:Transcriptional regulatory protein, C terminal